MNDLLNQARIYNNALEQNYLALAVTLAEIDATESWKEEYDSFADFYTKDLCREASTVSRLLTAGKWLKDNGGLPAGNVSYKKLTAAIKAFPDKEPEYIISAAQTLTYQEIAEEKTEQKFGTDHQHKIVGEKRWGACECGKHVLV